MPIPMQRQVRAFTEAKAELLKLGSVAAYLRRYPDPILILEPIGQAGPTTIHTPPQGEMNFAQTTTDFVATPQLFSGLGSMVPPNAELLWLAKTDRNPFAGLVTIGRAGNNDVIFVHPTISKLHAIVHRDGSGWSIEDRGSTNGTFLDGVRLPANERRALNDGSQLRFGEGVSARFFEPESFWDFCQLLGDG